MTKRELRILQIQRAVFDGVMDGLRTTLEGIEKSFDRIDAGATWNTSMTEGNTINPEVISRVAEEMKRLVLSIATRMAHEALEPRKKQAMAPRLEWEFET